MKPNSCARFEGQNGRLATLGIVAGLETGDLAGDALTPPTLLVLTARIGQRISLYLSGEITRISESSRRKGDITRHRVVCQNSTERNPE